MLQCIYVEVAVVRGQLFVDGPTEVRKHADAGMVVIVFSERCHESDGVLLRKFGETIFIDEEVKQELVELLPLVPILVINRIRGDLL